MGGGVWGGGMVFNATFNNISVNIVAVSFIGRGNLSIRGGGGPSSSLQVTDKLYHILFKIIIYFLINLLWKTRDLTISTATMITKPSMPPVKYHIVFDLGDHWDFIGLISET